MKEESTPCPVCGERLALQGLSFFMVNVVIDKHSKASPKCSLQVEFLPEEKRIEIKQASAGTEHPSNTRKSENDGSTPKGWRLIN